MFDDNFVEKMMELGIGMNMIRQIPSLMDGVLPTMQSNVRQCSQTPPPVNTKGNTYIVVNNQQVGPLTEAELKKLVRNGIITSETLVWEPGMLQWAVATQVPLVNKLILLESIPQSAASKTTNANTPHPLQDEVISALAALGYSNAVTRKLVEDVLNGSPDITSSEAVKLVLKSF